MSTSTENVGIRKRNRFVPAKRNPKHVHFLETSLVKISDDCLVAIVDRLNIDSIAVLLQSGDKMLYNKLTNHIEALRHVPAHGKNVNSNAVVTSVVTRCTKLKSLFMTRCLCNSEELDCSRLPSTLTDLTIRPCGDCLFPPRPRILYNRAPVKLPNLQKLDLDISSFKAFPIKVSAAVAHLRLYLRNGDNAEDVTKVLCNFPNLTSLHLKTPSASCDIGLRVLDCAKFPNLVDLSVPCKTRVKNVHKSFERITLKVWDDSHPFDRLFRHSAHFTDLTYVGIGLLATNNPNDTLLLLAKIAPSLQTLNVWCSRAKKLSVNVFELFPNLVRVHPCLCFNPIFWPSIPKHLSLLPSPRAWQFSEWFGSETESLDFDNVKRVLSTMPAFKRIQLDGQYYTVKFMEAIPDAVLQHVEFLAIESNVSSRRLLLLATRVKFVMVDFLCHFIDFSNCTQLQDLRLHGCDIEEDDNVDTSLLVASVATINSPIETLVYLAEDVDSPHKLGSLPMSLTSRFAFLRNFGSGLKMTGNYDSLPFNLTSLTLQIDWREPKLASSITSFLQKRKRSALAKIRLSCANNIADFEPVKGWKMTTGPAYSRVNQIVWTRTREVGLV